MVYSKLPTCIGRAYRDDHWVVSCPRCDDEMEYWGFFDSADKYECEKCEAVFVCSRIDFDDGSYIE